MSRNFEEKVSDYGLQDMFYKQNLPMPQFFVGLCLISDYRGVGLGRFHCTGVTKST